MPGLGLGLGVRGMQPTLLARYNLGGKAPAVIADPGAGVYGLGGRAVGFDGLFTFSGLSASWKLNALGHWVKVQAGEPRTGHHAWKGGKLVPTGIAVCSEVRTNLVRYSEALDESLHWEPSNAVVVEPAGELSGIPAFRLTDANTSGYAQINQTGVTHGGGVHVFRMLVAKDQNPTSQFSIRLVYSVDGVGIFSGMSLKVNTGSPVSSWNPNILERKVEDLGDHWMVWFAVDLTGAGAVTVQLFPAHNNTSGGGGAERVGSHVCTAVQFHPGRYPQDYIKTDGAAVSIASESLQIDPSLLSSAFGGIMPEALTLVMKGSMSYADEDLVPQIMFFNQSVDNENNLQALLNTVDARTGQMQVFYRENGNFSAVSSAAAAFSPGSDVPFSLALVLTATELEGFCNGVSNGKTTHGGIANLLSSPMELFSSGTGTIEHFAIYTGNPGAAALQEATA